MLLYCLGEESESVLKSTKPTEEQLKEYDTEVFQDFAIFNRKPSSVVHACAKRHAVMHVYICRIGVAWMRGYSYSVQYNNNTRDVVFL